VRNRETADANPSVETHPVDQEIAVGVSAG
jgi:hypothetical protein